MQRLLPLCVVGALALGVAACGDDDDGDTQKLTLETKGALTLFVEDNGRRGPTAGDERTYSQPLLEDGEQVGTIDGSTTIIGESEGFEHRLGTTQFTLADGTILASGIYDAKPGVAVPARGVVRPIVGGTGTYEGAEGTVTQTAISGGQIRSVIEFTTDD